MAIDNVRLPVNIEQGAEFTLRHQTSFQIAYSGKENRVIEWDQARWEADISYAVQSLSDLQAIFAIARGRSGAGLPFKVKNWMDYTVTAGAIGTGDGSTAAFQLVKVYTDGVVSTTKTIQLPITGTLIVYVNGVAKTETTHYTVSYTTGVITFTGGNIPSMGQAITATFEYDIAMRFVDDTITARLERADLGDIPSIELIEVLDE